jgi:hypothetical protein
MEDSPMEDSDEALLPVWRANLVVLTASTGAATRLARMMSFSASYLKLILAGQRDFSEEFVRGVEAVTGLPQDWMNTPHGAGDIPGNTQAAIDNETPYAKFRGTAYPTRKKSVLRAAELPIQADATRRLAEAAVAVAEQHRRRAHFRKVRDLATQEVRRLEWHLSHPPVELAALRAKVDDVTDASELDPRVRADLAGRLEQIEKHQHLLVRHVDKLLALLARLDADA